MCQKHYMRERRHGDSGTVGRAGRPAGMGRDIYRTYMPERSERTLTKYHAGVIRLEYVFGDRYGEVMPLVGKRRTNGHRMNFTAFEEESRTLHAIHLARIGEWPHGVTISAEDYLTAAEVKFPHLMAIYNEFVQVLN